MKRVIFLIFIFSLLFTISVCSSKEKEGEVSLNWKGHMSIHGENTLITIFFSGNMVNKDGSKMLTASKLTLKGGDFSRDIEFNNSNCEKSSDYWIFRTKSSNPSYPYGIVSISRDYKSINGQLPDQESITTFFSDELKDNSKS